MLLARGKVRELYELDGDLLMVASDRISTYDVVHPTEIPDKGKVLTGLSALWFDLTHDIVANHVISYTDGVPAEHRGRALRAKKLDMLPVECVVRGYISGSGWKDYQATGKVSGIELPEGLRESDRLPEPIYTPSTKAEEGHDEAIDFEATVELAGSRELAEQLRDTTLAVYEAVAAHALERGVILADTKFEFGLDPDGDLVLGDEVCTPDSSRFWPADTYEPGKGQPSFDKQYVRDWASGTGWDKSPPAPADPRGRGGRDARALRHRLREARGRAVLRLDRAHSREGPGPDPPEGGDPRPAGPGGRARAAGAGLRRRLARARRPARGARRRGPRPPAGDVRAPARQPADRGLRDPVKFGVVRFPGSCDDVDAMLAAQRVGEAVILWHQDTDLQDVDAVIVPGGFSYGDYLRVGAIARFAPIMGEVERFARNGGLVLGICNGFQVLCEAGLLSGALLPNTSLRFVCRQVELEVVNASIPWTRSCSVGDRLSIPAKHTTGRYYAPDPVLDELEANDQIVLRYAPGENLNGSARDIAGVCNAAGNVLGLMPHPEHAVDVLTGSVDGLKLIGAAA